MGHSNVWNSHPKSYGPGSRAWQCFRSNAKEIGFIKVRLDSRNQNVLLGILFRKGECLTHEVSSLDGLPPNLKRILAAEWLAFRRAYLQRNSSLNYSGSETEI
ncbi:hypothetical protein NL676_024823 [Syzygium grande]|nr:hypothetical protein NL676_024823 [Syzygium grande]